jgi:hypothetical protein
MQVVVHLGTVEPSDAHCDDRIADDGRGGKEEEKLKTESQPRGFAAKKHWDNVR